MVFREKVGSTSPLARNQIYTDMKPVRLIIAGGRDFADSSVMEHAVFRFIQEIGYYEENTAFDRLEIVLGGQKNKDGSPSADELGSRLADRYGIQKKTFPADWDTHGKAAGPIRNSEMAAYATHCICFWDCESRGTHDMIKKAKARGLPLKVIFYYP